MKNSLFKQGIIPHERSSSIQTFFFTFWGFFFVFVHKHIVVCVDLLILPCNLNFELIQDKNMRVNTNITAIRYMNYLPFTKSNIYRWFNLKE